MIDDTRRDFILGSLSTIGAAQAAPAQNPQEKLEAVQVAAGALDIVLRERVQMLFSVWMADNTDQPARASEGLAKAIAAYHFGRNLIGLQTAPNRQIRVIMIEGLNNAWRDYLVKLFHSWLQDTGGRPEQRHQRLMDNAMNSYLYAYSQLDLLYPP